MIAISDTEVINVRNFLREFSDNQVIESAHKVVKREREILIEVLLHFLELDRRKLFSKYGYSSLHDYAVKVFKYSDDQAYMRITAMRMIREIPEIERKVAEGALTLSALSKAQTFFRKEDHSKEDKKEILKRLENASKREVKAILNQDVKARYSFETDEKQESVVERLKGLHPHLTFDELMNKICGFALEHFDPAEKAARQRQKSRADLKPCGNFEKKKASFGSRYLPAEVKRAVRLKAGGKCQRCSSTFALEFDHIVPFAKGGPNTRENIRLLCKSCNQRKAIEHYGVTKMEKFSRGYSRP